jgi:hypothetical protein
VRRPFAKRDDGILKFPERGDTDPRSVSTNAVSGLDLQQWLQYLPENGGRACCVKTVIQGDKNGFN